MSDKSVTMLGVGDLMLCMPNAKSYFEMVTPTLKAADVVVGQAEIVFTSRGIPTYSEAMFPASDPRPDLAQYILRGNVRSPGRNLGHASSVSCGGGGISLRLIAAGSAHLPPQHRT